MNPIEIACTIPAVFYTKAIPESPEWKKLEDIVGKDKKDTLRKTRMALGSLTVKRISLRYP